MSSNTRPAHLTRQPVSTYEEVEQLIQQSNVNILIHHEHERPSLAEALRRNGQSAQESLRLRQRLPQVILEEFIFYEFHILESWNLTRLGYVVPHATTEDIFDDNRNFPLRSAALQADVIVPARPWLRFRSGRRAPREHEAIVHDFMQGALLTLSASEVEVLQQHGLAFMLGQQAPTRETPLRQSVGAAAPQTDVQNAIQEDRQDVVGRSSLVAPPEPAAPATWVSSNVPQAQPYLSITEAPMVQMPSTPLRAPTAVNPADRARFLAPPPSQQLHAQIFPSHVVVNQPSAPQAVPVQHPGRQAAQATLAQAGSQTIQPAIVPAVANNAVGTQQVAAKKPREHVGLKDALSPNLPFPPNANITIPEIMTFAPQWLRSIDVINRVYQNHGGQKALANMATAHRKNEVKDNFLWISIIRSEMTKTFPDWKPQNHPMDPSYPRTINVSGLRTFEIANPRRGARNMYPNHPVPFRQLADNVKHFPVGADALDLTRCVQYVVDHPDECKDLMFPTDYATVLNRVGGPAPVTNQHLDTDAFARWGKGTTTGSDRAQGKDAQWEQECDRHRARYWAQHAATTGAGLNHALPAAAPVNTNSGSRKRPHGQGLAATSGSAHDDDMPLKKRQRTHHFGETSDSNDGSSVEAPLRESSEEMARVETMRMLIASGSYAERQGISDHQRSQTYQEHRRLPEGPQYPGLIPPHDVSELSDRPERFWLLQQPWDAEQPGDSQMPGISGPQELSNKLQENQASEDRFQPYGYHSQGYLTHGSQAFSIPQAYEVPHAQDVRQDPEFPQPRKSTELPGAPQRLGDPSATSRKRSRPSESNASVSEPHSRKRIRLASVHSTPTESRDQHAPEAPQADPSLQTVQQPQAHLQTEDDLTSQSVQTSEADSDSEYDDDEITEEELAAYFPDNPSLHQ